MKFLRQYQERLQLEHGWQVELGCSNCGHSALPNFRGWSPNRALCFSERPTVFANISCSNCGNDLRKEAGKRLVSMFSAVAPPPANRRLVGWFTGLLVGIPLLLLGILFTGVQADWWGYQAFVLFAALSVFVGPVVMGFNYRVASIRRECVCRRPNYIFMGQLGRSNCYRCASCGNLLRLRD